MTLGEVTVFYCSVRLHCYVRVVHSVHARCRLINSCFSQVHSLMIRPFFGAL